MHGGDPMDRSRRQGALVGRKSGIARSIRRRLLTKFRPSCKPLDGRQLLSTVPMVALSVPPTTAVANAAADLNALNPTTFAQLESDLARAERHSHVTPAQASKLAQDEAGLDQDIQSVGLNANTTASDMNRVQNVVDDAFLAATYPAKTWANRRQALEQHVPAVPGAPQLISRTMAQMRVVARAARVTGPLHQAVDSDKQVLSDELGPTPNTNLGPGATDRDPLVVYYDGQVDKFVR
jgi:hypothetical protein